MKDDEKIKEIVEILSVLNEKLAELPDNLDISRSSADVWKYTFDGFLFIESKKSIRDKCS